MNLPEPQSLTFPSLISQIENGSIKIPQFQRSFVWTRPQSARLIDSIIKGFPIGTFILWRTQERLRSVRNIGNIDLPEPSAGDSVSYVLDGQQRLTSLFVSLKALQVELDDGVRDYGKMFINLLRSEDDDLVHIEDEGIEEYETILLSKLLEGDFQYLSSFPAAQQERIKIYKKRIESFQFSIIQVRDAPIEIATEIFTRLNIGGRPLSVFEIMVAKTYDHEREFDLLEKVTSIDDRLEEINFGGIPHSTMLHAASACLSGEVSKKAILRLPKNDIIENWETIDDAIVTAIDYLRDAFGIPVSRLLPFPAVMVAFVYFFYKSELPRPDGDQRKRLADFFWRVSLGGRYSQSMETHLTSDLKKIDKIIGGEAVVYDWPIDPSPEFIQDNGYFQAGRSFIKAMLVLLAANNPKSFDSGNPVRVRNDWLKQANSKNYHHFFPRSYMKKNSDEDEEFVNHIANITLVDDYLNKRVIRAQAPSIYLKKFQAENENLGEDMSSHFIDLEKDGVLEDDYETFFDHRVEALSRELRRRIIPQEIDKVKTVLVEDEESSEDEESV